MGYDAEKIPYPPNEIKEAGKLFYPMLLAISFLHCKNVKMTPVLPRPKSTRKEINSAPPATKIYTLEIEPMRKILETEGDSSRTGLKLALHICRGHFKDFSKGTGLFGKYKGKQLGTFSVMATQSFHETKNFTSGEGGALLINDEKYIEDAEILREKGTNRSRFFRRAGG